jgi:polysaccharide export outer membrane protein
VSIPPRSLLAIAAILTLSGCALPATGPSYSQATAPSRPGDIPFAVVQVTDSVAQAANVADNLRFGPEFTGAKRENTAPLTPGERLDLRIWESVENGLYTQDLGSKFAALPTQVDEAGKIYIPYGGSIQAAGRTTDQLRAAVVKALEDKTRDPQVEVVRAPVPDGARSGSSRTIKVIGRVGNGGVHEIRRETAQLLGMLSTVIGPVEDPEVVQVAIRRGARTGRAWLQDVYDDPAMDVAVRAGDTVIVERDRRAFVALGATGQRRVQFPSRDISALGALGLVGGLNTQLSDPRGIFVFRQERSDVARKVAKDGGASRVAYVIDLTKPGGMFTADSFQMRDGDVLYVTEAPIVLWFKILKAVAPTVNFASSATTLGG